MKIDSRIRNSIVLVGAACALLSASASQAAGLAFHVDVDTSSLSSNPNGPFYLDFQLNYGSGPFGNSVVINNFTYNGGATVGSSVLYGSATGDIASSVSMADNTVTAFNELYQGFTPGTSLGFDVYLTSNQTILTPDGFSFAILDHDTFQIPTSDPNSGLSLVTVNITGPSIGLGNVNVYAGVNDPEFGNYEGVTASVTAVPEPGTTTLLALAGLTVGGMTVYRRRRSAQVA